MGALDEIRHVVVLMFENQSFDRLLGYLTLDDPGEKLEGLTGGESNPMSPPGDMTPIPVTKLSSPSDYVIDLDPGHDFEDVNQQLFGAPAPADTSHPTNNGFALNYSWPVGLDRRRLGPRGREIMASRSRSAADHPRARAQLRHLRPLVFVRPGVSSAAGVAASEKLSTHQRALLALARVISAPPTALASVVRRSNTRRR